LSTKERISYLCTSEIMPIQTVYCTWGRT